MSRPTFIRAIWGNINDFDGKYRNQILNSFKFKDNWKHPEIVYTYGTEADNLLRHETGRRTHLMHQFQYDYRIATAHTFFDHRSLIHKLKILQTSLKDFESVIFLDWDMEMVKEPDESFYNSFDNFSLQVPLYLYPIDELDKLVGSKEDVRYFYFFTKLKNYLKQHAWLRNDSYVLPNTGFIYCSDLKIADELYNMAVKKHLSTVPDELAVLFYAKELGFDIDDYILHFEPNVISGKDCGSDEWNKKGKELESYIEKVKTGKKDIYFKHV